MAIDLENRTTKAGKVVSGTNNIPTGFSTAAGSLILTGVVFAEGIYIDNRTAGAIAVNYSSFSASAAPSASDVDLYVNANTVVNLGPTSIGSVVYIQSDTGSAISSGTVTVSVY